MIEEKAIELFYPSFDASPKEVMSRMQKLLLSYIEPLFMKKESKKVKKSPTIWIVNDSKNFTLNFFFTAEKKIGKLCILC